PGPKFTSLWAEDVGRFRKALAQAGVEFGGPEPALALSLRYEAELDLATAAAEVGYKSAELSAKLAVAPASLRPLGPLNVRGGAVPREVFLAALPDLLRELRLGGASRPDL